MCERESERVSGREGVSGRERKGKWEERGEWEREKGEVGGKG